jgi:membrane associated rhomboid family serine protease
MSVREYNSPKKILLGQSDNALVMLVAVNAIVFVALHFIQVAYYLSYNDAPVAEKFFNQQILDWVQLPASFNQLITRPWTLFTFMFCNYSVYSFISNILWLWAFGYIFQDLAGNKKVFPVYLYGGFAGALFFLLSVNFIPAFHSTVIAGGFLSGSGTAVLAIALAVTTLAPDFRIFPLINGGIPLWILTIVFVAVDFATIGSVSGGYAIAHLAGGFIGFVFIKQLRRGIDWSNWMINFANWVNDLFDPEKKHKQKSTKEHLFYKADGNPYKKTPNVTQQKLDDILDKINQHGYYMLTDEEKDFLKRASKEEL